MLLYLIGYVDCRSAWMVVTDAAIHALLAQNLVLCYD